MLAASVHRQKVPLAARPDDWRGIWSPHYLNSGKEHKATDLGHCGVGVIQKHNKVVLSWRGWRFASLWYHEERYLHTPDPLARRSKV